MAYDKGGQTHTGMCSVVTITAGQSMVPLMVPFADNGLIITQSVALITAESHLGANGKVITMPLAIYRNPRIQA